MGSYGEAELRAGCIQVCRLRYATLLRSSRT